MADKTGIEWTDASWNPVVGCSIVSPGCTHCYAMSQAARILRCAAGANQTSHYEGTVETVKGKPVWTGKVALAPERILTQPLRWPKGRRIFVNSMGDLFHEDVPDEWIDRVFAVMALSPQHTYQVLTKRSARMRTYMDMACGRIADIIIRLRRERGDANMGALPLSHVPLGSPWWPLSNVWLGVSAEDQRRADERIPDLQATPAAIRFVSAEPLLGPVDFGRIPSPVVTPEDEGYYHSVLAGGDTHYRDSDPDYDGKVWIDAVDGPIMEKLDWVIVGGESGPGARPMHPDWVRAIRDQCAAAGTAFFVKQWGEWGPISGLTSPSAAGQLAAYKIHSSSDRRLVGQTCWHAGHGPDVSATILDRVGKRRAGRLLDGVEHNAMPEVRRHVVEIERQRQLREAQPTTQEPTP